MTLLHLAVLTPFLFAILVPMMYKSVKRIHTGWFVLPIPAMLFSYFLSNFPAVAAEHHIVRSWPWIQQLHIHFTIYLDSLSLLFTLIITGVGALVVLYSIFYMAKEREALHNFYVYLLCFMGAMLGVVLSDNLLMLYTFWEATSISSFLLIAYWYQRKRSREGAAKSMLITLAGGFAMLLGFLFIYAATGTFSIREIIAQASVLADHSLFLPAMALILLGAFTKSAQFPFHIWLPDAMEAPTPISAYLHSATMVKAGIYLVARLTPVFGGHLEWFWITTAIGIVTLFWGSFMAIRQVDLKAMLAYSTVSQLGIMMTLLGIGSMALHPNVEQQEAMLYAGAILAAIFHLVNHSIFKGCLFMVIGILDHELGTRDIRKLGGLMSLMPISFTLTIVGAFSMAGLPPFSGFLSKEMFFTGVLTAYRGTNDWLIVLPAAAFAASVFTFVYCMILVFKTFTGKFQPELLDKPSREAPVGMLIAPTILASLVVVLFFFPNLLSHTILGPSVQAIVPNLLAPGEHFDTHIRPWHGFNMELFMTLGVIGLGALLFIRLHRWTGIYDYLPRKFTLNRLFDGGIAGLENLSAKITNVYMTGFIRHYFMYIFGFLILLVGGALLWSDALIIDVSENAPIHLYEFSLGISLAAASIYIVFSTSRLASIISLSAVGYLVSLFFVNFRAPDLALTQLVVETISTALFLLCFYFLPKLKPAVSRMPFHLSNLIISIGVGLTLTLVGLSAYGYKVFQPIASFYENAYELSGAKNIVNAILVDFRGFDTMLEIVVLFAAGLGVYALIELRQKGGRKL